MHQRSSVTRAIYIRKMRSHRPTLSVSLSGSFRAWPGSSRATGRLHTTAPVADGRRSRASRDVIAPKAASRVPSLQSYSFPFFASYTSISCMHHKIVNARGCHWLSCVQKDASPSRATRNLPPLGGAPGSIPPGPSGDRSSGRRHDLEPSSLAGSRFETTFLAGRSGLARS